MDIVVIKKLESYLRKADTVEISGQGEPLVSPALMNCLEILSSGDHSFTNHAGMALITNGTLLDEKKTQALLASPLSLHLSVSLDAANKETYYKIRGANFNQVVENIRNFVDERDRQNRETAKIWINMTLMGMNLSEAEEVVKLAHDLGVDGVSFGKLNSDREWETTRGDWVFKYHEQCLENIPNNIVAQVINRVKVRAGELGVPVYFDEIKDFGGISVEPCSVERKAGDTISVPITRPVIKEDHRIPLCENPWSWMVVDLDGKVRYCCLSDETIGNLRKQSCEQIWNSKAIQDVRSMLYEGRLPPACRRSPCKYAAMFKDKPDPEAIQILIPNPFKAEYKSHIESLEPVGSNENERIRLLARIRNTGSYSWKKEKTTDRVLLGAKLFEKNLIQPVREYRSELPNEIHPGDCAEIGLELDFAGLGPGTYVAVVDMIYGSKFWFMDNMNAVWVLMLVKEKDGSVQLIRSAEIGPQHHPSQEEASVKCRWGFWK
jgi:MoaA/NifB/PqqE/SkfB family radical SAM enzyme